MEIKEAQIKGPESVGKKPPEIMVDIETREKEDIPKGLETWMERVEKVAPKPVQINDDFGQPVLTPTNPVNPVITLPVTRKTFLAGFKLKISEAGRWLSESIFRLIKMKKGEVKFDQK